jgi:hypothetical protein
MKQAPNAKIDGAKKKEFTKSKSETELRTLRKEESQAKRLETSKKRSDYRDLVRREVNMTSARAKSMRVTKSKCGIGKTQKKVYAFNSDPAVRDLVLSPQQLSKMRVEAGKRKVGGAAQKSPTNTPPEGGYKKSQEKREMKGKKAEAERIARRALLDVVHNKNAAMLGPLENKLVALPMPVPIALQSAEAAKAAAKRGVMVIKHRRLSVIMAEQAGKVRKERAFYCFLFCIGLLGGFR